MDVLEQWAPPVLQASYDNSGLLVGDRTAIIDSVRSHWIAQKLWWKKPRDLERA